MNISFHPDAKQELYTAIDYYEKCQKGLGLEFAKEIFSTIQRIAQFPEAWAKLSKNTRRCLVNRFPYGVIYQKDIGHINIIAIMQLNKKPNYWKKRT